MAEPYVLYLWPEILATFTVRSKGHVYTGSAINKADYAQKQSSGTLQNTVHNSIFGRLISL